MKFILNALFVVVVGVSYSQQASMIRLNHLMIVVDSTTYTSLCNDDFIMNTFGYSKQKQLEGWEGLYITGQSNYLEIFHPKSIKGQTIVKGDNWTCYAAMQAGYVNSLVYDSTSIEASEDEYFNYLSCELNDSLSPFEVWEMKALQYETWTKQFTKKEFQPGMSFNPVDYNHPAEADSSNNYLFNDIVGVTYSVPSADSTKAIGFFDMCGYSIIERTIDRISFENGAERITLFFNDKINTVLVNSIELELNENCRKKEYLIGSSGLTIDGNSATWYFD